MLKDVRGRDLDTTIIYYGKARRSELDEYVVRNHQYKVRSYNKLPRDGKYCSPEELVNEVSENVFEQINKNFRNVQYYMVNDDLYWIYCLKSTNIYGFTFIGKKLSIDIVRTLLESKRYNLGYRREDNYSNEIQVWYSKERLILFCVEFKKGYVTATNVYFKKFDTKDFIIISNTEMIFRKQTYQPIPLIDEYPVDDDMYWARNVVDVQTSSEKILGPEYCNEIAGNDTYSKLDFDEMLKYIFNKR